MGIFGTSVADYYEHPSGYAGFWPSPRFGSPVIRAKSSRGTLVLHIPFSSAREHY